MLDGQRMARNGPASALLLAWVFLALSLAGFVPDDAPGLAAEPANTPPANPCGPVGATLAFVLFQAMGWSSYVFLLGLAVFDLLLFRRRAVPEAGLQLLGFALTIAVGAAVVQRYLPGLDGSPPVGSGGYLGALEVSFLEGQFGPAGMLLIVGAAGVTGLVLCSDVLILWPFRELLRWTRGLGRRGPSVREDVERGEGTLALSSLSYNRGEVDPDRIATSPSRPSLVQPPVADAVVTSAEARGLNQPAITRAVPPEAHPRLAGGIDSAPNDGRYQLPPLELLEPAP